MSSLCLTLIKRELRLRLSDLNLSSYTRTHFHYQLLTASVLSTLTLIVLGMLIIMIDDHYNIAEPQA